MPAHVLLTNEQLAIRQGATWSEYQRDHVPGYKVARGRSPDFPSGVMKAIAQVGFDLILSFILPALTFVLINSRA
jgi:hypothetical protein